MIKEGKQKLNSGTNVSFDAQWTEFNELLEHKLDGLLKLMK